MKVKFKRKELALIKYCLWAEFGSDNASWIVEGVHINKLRRNIQNCLDLRKK